MLIALINGVPSKPKPNTRGICPYCNTSVISRCGSIKIWHWAHESLSDCDLWHENEGWWHLNWKNEMQMLRRDIKLEQVMKIDYPFETVRHIADMVINGVVIELQSSPISPYEIQIREAFYKNMIWVFNGTDYDYHLFGEFELDSQHKLTNLLDRGGIIKWVTFKIKWLRKSLLYCNCPVAIDVGTRVLRIQTLHKNGRGSCDVFPKETFMQYLSKL